MIVDRTLQDVISAINILSKKIKNNIPPTNDELKILERGTFTIESVNRIESKSMELKHILNNMGYYNMPTPTKEWNVGDVFKRNDLERIISNCIDFVDGFFVFLTTPRQIKTSYYYEEINKIEQILSDIEIMAREIRSLFQYCGQIECGG